MHCLPPRSMTLCSPPERTVSEAVSRGCPALPNTVCDLIGEYVGQRSRRGLPELWIDTSRSGLDPDIRTPVLIDPIIEEIGRLEPCSAEPEPDHPEVGQGVLLGQHFLIDSIELLAARQKSLALATPPCAVLTLMKWQYLFNQIYQPEVDPRENLDNLVIFKASLAVLDIDELLMHTSRVVPILGDDLRKAALLEFHRLLGSKNFSKALFLTSYGLNPTELDSYRYFRERGCEPCYAALMVINQRGIHGFSEKPATIFAPKLGDFSLFQTD